ncbi:MAG: sigma-70 family RNA polymerase sigma factor [Actinobacteria bacterium]|nr:sigma-70 family RNA polymerase sigma factor [Actinomycetota bacterium]
MEAVDSTIIEVAALAELLERAAGRGYVLLSELHELHDPLTQPESWVEEMAQSVRDRGLQVVDDLSESEIGAERPEAQPMSASSDPIRQYLNEIGRTDLLTAEDEVNLAKRYQAGLHASRIVRGGMKLVPRRKAMLLSIMRDGANAKDHMIRANLRLVVSNARKYRGRGLDLLGLIQEGNLGLIRAVEKFDHTKGYKFSTYATWWIRQALQRGLADKARTVRLPAHVFETLGKIRFVELDLLQQLGREPHEDEVAAELDMSVERLREIRQAAQDVTSLDTPVGEDGDATLGELVADEEAIDPSKSATSVFTQAEVAAALSALDARERAVLMWRFGMMDGEEHTLEEIGEQFGLTRERIRQIEKKTLTKLRHPARAFRLRGLLEGTDIGPN